MRFIAHSKNQEGQEHELKKHLNEVAKLMESFTDNAEFKKLSRTVGLLHDFGKYQPAFQNYLRNGGRRGSVPHASWGASLGAKLNHFEAAFVIDGHHKGLPDKADLKSDIAEFQNDDHELSQKILPVFTNENNFEPEENHYNDLGLRGFDKELFIRYLFSSLTDADWLDTENHFNSQVTDKRKKPHFDPEFLMRKLEKEISQKSKEGKVNELRNRVREYAISNAQNPIGFFSMTLPTGMGKTLTSVDWALNHAQYNSLKRIIVVLPFINIIDQTAKELKRIFGEEWVLEHHSNYNEDKENNDFITDENTQDEAYTKRLATENWDYPVIVTTTVQFFESLFSNKPSRCRKIHNIAHAVIIFDEVQTLPKELVLPTLTMLKNIQKVMCTTFLFCTATQPAFEKRAKFDGIDNITPLVENPKEVFESTKRVEYHSLNNYNPVSLDILQNFVTDQETSALCIFNTKKQALNFFKLIQDSGEWITYHLSTGMCPAHRKMVIEQIQESLKAKERIIVSSTQLIEAGVDFDFPCVFREIAPLESIIQSAGRCNREGAMLQPGNVFIFKLENAGTPDKLYKTLAEFANELYGNAEEKLHEHDFFGQYYSKAINLFCDPDKHHINDARKNFNFKTISDAYRLIVNNTTPLFIYKYNNQSELLYHQIIHKPILSRHDYRQMQQYTVQVYDLFLKANTGMIGREKAGFLVWYGNYDEHFGISSNSELDTLIV